MEFYLIRHGQSEANRDRIAQGHLDSPLSDLGLEQAKNLASVLPIDVDAIYASPLSRAKTTAELGTQHIDLDIIEDPDLKEISIGDAEGMRSEDIEVRGEDRIAWGKQIRDPFSSIYNSEPLNAFKQRTSQSFDRIVEVAKSNNYTRVYIFSHGGTMRSILTHHLKVLNVQEHGFKNTEILRISYGNPSWKLIERKNDHIVFEL